MTQIDRSFMMLHGLLENLSSVEGEISDKEAGIRSYVYEFEIESPVELDVVRDEAGELLIGSTPPLYDVNTTFRPSFHKMRLRASLENHGS